MAQARKPRTQHHSAAFPWKWIALALCLASLLGAAHHFRHHWQGPLTQRVHQMELHARSQLADTALYIQGPFAKKARAWNHSVRQGFLHKRCDFTRYQPVIPSCLSLQLHPVPCEVLPRAVNLGMLERAKHCICLCHAGMDWSRRKQGLQPSCLHVADRIHLIHCWCTKVD